MVLFCFQLCNEKERWKFKVSLASLWKLTYVYTWNPFVLWFLGYNPPSHQAFSNKNKGTHLGLADNLHTWNPNDFCFGWKKPCFGGFTFKNRGHFGSRYVYIYI